MKYNQKPEETTSSQKRKLKTKPLILLIVILLAFNIFWFVGWLIPDKSKQTDEEVASVAGKPITREQWMSAMEKEVGRETLLDLVNEKVMAVAAEQYGINVSDKEIDLEISLIRSVDGRSHSGQGEEGMRQKIRSNLILEKVLTKDIVVKDDAVKKQYDENTALYNILTAYRTAIIVVPTKTDAEQTIEELSKGSSFDVLAKERSTDLASASLGGDIGYINDSTDATDKAIVEAVSNANEGLTSGVITLSDGTYAVIRVSEVVKGQSFSFKEVKDHIKREIALEQLPQTVSPEAFWKEFDAKWFYGK
ncbi:peptidyl-prolyl cis-trans isomerase [Sporosarcina sp. E16_3]|uniref:peptidyl-prolyl cis-trans isomerase n=1 Tax=Sporosarcina sp. E16_3 TaxID=2789293 RepID=UPI001A92730B|nr:peptidyl-prolyl cis-trans isomerase [Sporosarcina sp. E16_3]MBO0602869.1 peptidyl-prolyl cis-trans isomerase [Sporosarcina sp. E16_3]